MRNYENLVIVKPTLTAEEIQASVKAIEEVITSNGGEIAATSSMGMRKLAYPVEKNERGVYTIVYFKAEGSVINELERNLKFNEEVIKFIKDCQKDLNDRTKDIPDDKKPSVYVGGIGFKGMHGIDSTECKYPPFEAVNAKNVADELNKEGHAFVSKEQILKWNPDVIFIDEAGLKLVIEDYKKNLEFYDSLKAFKNGDVYGLLPYNFYTTNIGTALADAYYIGKVLYPERFNDINPEEKADEIYTFLVGKPVYEQMKKQFGGFKKLEFE